MGSVPTGSRWEMGPTAQEGKWGRCGGQWGGHPGNWGIHWVLAQRSPHFLQFASWEGGQDLPVSAWTKAPHYPGSMVSMDQPGVDPALE